MGSQVTGSKAREMTRWQMPGHGGWLLVADRITHEARDLLNQAGWSWLDLRGQLHLRASGVLVDAPVLSDSPPRTHVTKPLPGRAALAVAYWLCAHPDEPLSPTGASSVLGFAPSTISTAMKAMAEGGLVDGSRIAILPELFWELAAQWRPQWTWLASSQNPNDWRDTEGSTTWVRAGDSVAIVYGAPAVSAGDGPLEFFAPGPVDLTIAARRYGLAAPGAGAAAVAVAPVRQVIGDGAEVPGEIWRIAPKLAVALQLAGDPARGREILRDWRGEGHVWN
jgi:hypothetical protein